MTIQSKTSKAEQVKALMADGRERTRNDVARGVGCSFKYATNILCNLVASGEISGEYMENFNTHIYRLNGKQVEPIEMPRTEAEYAEAMRKMAKREKKTGKLPPSFEQAKQEITNATIRRWSIWDFIAQYPGMTKQQMADEFEVSRRTVDGDIRYMLKMGWVESDVGTHSMNIPAKYYATQKRMAAERPPGPQAARASINTKPSAWLCVPRSMTRCLSPRIAANIAGCTTSGDHY